MPRLLDHLTDLFKKTDTIDYALRYNAMYYSPVHKMLRKLDSMDRSAQLTLSDYHPPSEDTLADLVRECAFISCAVVRSDDKEVRCVC